MLLEEVLTEISSPIPSTYRFWSFKSVYTKAFKCCDYKFKIGALRTCRTWETVADCMENIGKCQQWLISPRNCFENALYWGPCIFVPRYGQARNTGEGCLALCWGDHNNAKEKVFPMHYHSITYNTTIIWMPKLSVYNAVAWILFSSEYCNCENVICVVI